MFEIILKYLRTDVLIDDLSVSQLKELQIEAEYFQLASLQGTILFDDHDTPFFLIMNFLNLPGINFVRFF